MKTVDNKVAEETIIERNSNIELLRIISMFMVLVLHALRWSGALEYITGAHYWIYWWMEALSIVAVNVFVLISGYFLVESKFKAKNILSPFINKMIRALSKRQFSTLVVVLVAMFSLRSTFLPITWSQDSTGGMGILTFVMLYCIAAWVRLYYNHSGCVKKYALMYFGMSILLPISKKLILLLLNNPDLSGKMYGYQSLFVVIEATALFLAFLYAKPITGKISEFINKVAKHSFSVYIIHFSMLDVLFTDILPVDQFIYNPLYGAGAIILACMMVYVFCTVVDVVKCWGTDKAGQLIQNWKVIKKYHKLLVFYDRCVNEE